MTTVSGNSGLGYQTLLDRVTLTNVQIELDFSTGFPIAPARLGYYYLFLVAKTTPFQAELLLRDAIYKPGVRLFVPAQLTLANFNYSLIAYWNVNNVPYTVIYV